MNKVILIGRLTADPQSGRTNSGKAYARFSLAVNRLGARDADITADFINIVAWDKQAETAAKYLLKGRQVAIVGHIQTGSYERDGVKRSTFDVVAENVEFIGNAQNNGTASAKDASIDGLQEVGEDDDMPF